MSLKVPVAVSLALIAVWLTAASSSRAQSPELVLTMSDTIVDEQGHHGFIQVYMSNFVDSIIGFNMMIESSRPELLWFDADVQFTADTSYWQCTEWDGPDCIDSLETSSEQSWDFLHIDSFYSGVIPYDTSGSMCSGWENFGASTWSGDRSNAMVFGVADDGLIPGEVPGIAPQQGGLLYRLPFTIGGVPDTLTDCLVEITVNTVSEVPGFCFVSPDLDCIGMSAGGQVDTTRISIQDLLINVCDASPPLCGDFDCDGFLDISDLVASVSYMFGGGPTSPCPWNLDCDYDGEITVTDLVSTVQTMFMPIPQTSNQAVNAAKGE